MKCDVCSTQGDGENTSPDLLKLAVVRGFNPYALKITNDLDGQRPENVEIYFENWKRILFNDPTDWYLCNQCLNQVHSCLR